MTRADTRMRNSASTDVNNLDDMATDVTSSRVVPNTLDSLSIVLRRNESSAVNGQRKRKQEGKLVKYYWNSKEEQNTCNQFSKLWDLLAGHAVLEQRIVDWSVWLRPTQTNPIRQKKRVLYLVPLQLFWGEGHRWDLIWNHELNFSSLTEGKCFDLF